MTINKMKLRVIIMLAFNPLLLPFVNHNCWRFIKRFYSACLIKWPLLGHYLIFGIFWFLKSVMPHGVIKWSQDVDIMFLLLIALRNNSSVRWLTWWLTQCERARWKTSKIEAEFSLHLFSLFFLFSVYFHSQRPTLLKSEFVVKNEFVVRNPEFTWKFISNMR